MIQFMRRRVAGMRMEVEMNDAVVVPVHMEVHAFAPQPP